eukprot:TRINITY_DN8316_c0_g1_i1.p1 TRINITY_DN8316_c0_g1~~TRINITY_DN8316_c0_g1_i1.p1  ORF type:complete len:625 (-),score=240.09 TRINITY_DN8316_c0_g1_i1:101-1975(-)
MRRIHNSIPSSSSIYPHKRSIVNDIENKINEVDSIQTRLSKKQCNFGNYSVISTTPISTNLSQPIPIKINQHSPIKFINPSPNNSNNQSKSGSKTVPLSQTDRGNNRIPPNSLLKDSSSTSTSKPYSNPSKQIQSNGICSNNANTNQNNIKNSPQTPSNLSENVRSTVNSNGISDNNNSNSLLLKPNSVQNSIGTSPNLLKHLKNDSSGVQKLNENELEFEDELGDEVWESIAKSTERTTENLDDSNLLGEEEDESFWAQVIEATSLSNSDQNLIGDINNNQPNVIPTSFLPLKSASNQSKTQPNPIIHSSPLNQGINNRNSIGNSHSQPSNMNGNNNKNARGLQSPNPSKGDSLMNSIPPAQLNSTFTSNSFTVWSNRDVNVGSIDQSRTIQSNQNNVQKSQSIMKSSPINSSLIDQNERYIVETPTRSASTSLMNENLSLIRSNGTRLNSKEDLDGCMGIQEEDYNRIFDELNSEYHNDDEREDPSSGKSSPHNYLSSSHQKRIEDLEELKKDLEDKNEEMKIQLKRMSEEKVFLEGRLREQNEMILIQSEELRVERSKFQSNLVDCSDSPDSQELSQVAETLLTKDDELALMSEEKRARITTLQEHMVQILKELEYLKSVP